MNASLKSIEHTFYGAVFNKNVIEAILEKYRDGLINVLFELQNRHVKRQICNRFYAFVLH